MLIPGRKKITWGLLNCCDGTHNYIDADPFIVGTGNSVDLRINGTSHLDGECHFTRKNGKLHMTSCSNFVLNEEYLEEAVLEPRTDYALRISNTFLLIRGDKSLTEWASSINLTRWLLLLDENGEKMDGPYDIDSAIREVQRRMLNDEAFFGLFPDGSERAFLVDPHTAGKIQSSGETDFSDGIDIGEGELLCPNCWMRFDYGDLMHIASHHELMGDPILGEDALQRFFATRFDEDGNALDPMGNPSMGIACPHCHTELPVDFTHTSYNIISLVGNASAGKSYYLSVLSRTLSRTLIKNFGIFMQDADPGANAPLTEMRNRLFGGSDADSAALDKTVLGGNMYRGIHRLGRFAKMPRPFSFVLHGNSEDSTQQGITFFDNAGEHFQPGIELQDSPGALHVASASGILFLFDPLRNIDFREKLVNGTDPQLKSPMNDVQSVILSEMKTRIARIKGLSFDGRMNVPIAFIVGKFDAWSHMIAEDELLPYIHDNGLSTRAVEHNSNMVRDLLLETCPELVANAESLSTNVRFFPSSSFGHTPIQTENGSIAPIPSKLKPINVDAPTIWVLAHGYTDINIVD